MANNSKQKAKPVKRNIHITKSGQKIKLHQSLMQRYVARKDAKDLKKAEKLRDLPKGRIERLLYHLQPKRMYHYWFSREGGVMALKILGIGFISLFLLLIGVFAYFRKDLPNLKDISGSNIGGSIRYFDKTGQTLLWEDYDAVKRIPVQSDQISKYMKDATVALEDREFYKHGGFDLKGIMRAGVSNISGGGTKQGGSTITQQLVKLTQDWTKDRTYTRKIKELILAVELERTYSKDEILTGYLNAAPYGNIEYGVEAAARDYFQKSAKDLSLDESVFLASIPKSPSTYSPYGPYFNEGGKEAGQERMKYALGVMKELGKITQKQYDEAVKVDVLAKVKQQPPKFNNITAPYFVLAAKEQLENKFAQTYKRGGWKVITTLDLDLQKLAEKSLNDGRAQMNRQGADNAGFVAEDNETGQVVALIGGVDFNNKEYGQINYARDVNISPGSSIKPYDYVTFIENNNNVGAGSILYDDVGPLPGYPCTNRALPPVGNCLNDYDRRQKSGPMTLRYALGGSRNIPAVKAMLSAVPNDTSNGRVNSINKVMSTISGLMNREDGYRCYIPGTDVTKATKTDQTQCGAAAGIGDGAYLNLTDHVNGIASISRLGKAIPQTFILKVTDSANKTLDEFKPATGNQVVRQDSAYIVSDMASDPKASYLGGSCTDKDCFGMKFHRYKGWKNAIKTGTTNDSYDGLMVSWNTKYSAGIWVGNHSRTVSFSGGPENMTDPIMKQFMQGAIDRLGDVPANNWQQPGSVKLAQAYVMSSKVFAAQSVPSPSQDLFPGWYQGKSTSNKKQTIDVISNKLATECTPDLAKKDASGAAASAFSSDVFVGAGVNTSEKDDVHNCSDARPTISISTSPAGVSFNITATVSGGTHPLAGNTDKGAGKVNFIVDGNVIKSIDLTDGQSTYSTSYTPTSGGSHSISAQVVDSVLYDASTSSSSVGAITLTQSTAGANVTFSWSGNSGNVTVYTSAGATVCSGSSGCSRPKALLPNGTSVYGVDSASNPSPTITVSY